MTIEIETKPVPLHIDEYGAIMITGTRIPVDTVIYAFRQGDTAEEIVDAFDVLKLADVYSIIGYYLAHLDEMDAYLQTRAAEAADIQTRLEARFPPFGLRERLLARQEARDAQTGG